VTALATCGPLLLAAEGPHLRFYHSKDSKLLATKQIFKTQVIHGLSVHYRSSRHVIVVIWGGAVVRVLELHIPPPDRGTKDSVPDILQLSSTVKASDWILDLCFCPFDSGVCAAITAHNALLELKIGRQNRDETSNR